MLAQARRIEQYSRLGMPGEEREREKGRTNYGIPFASQPEQSTAERRRRQEMRGLAPPPAASSVTTCGGMGFA